MVADDIAMRELEPQISRDVVGILADASAELLMISDVATAIRRVLKFAHELMAADGYGVWRALDSGGQRWRVVASGGVSADSQRDFVVDEAHPLTDLTIAEDVFSHPGLVQRREFYEAEGIRSMVRVVLKIENEACVTVSFYYRQPRRFSETDCKYARALGNLAVSALYTSELQEAQHRERSRLKFLAEASAILASSLHYEDTLRSIARLAVPYLADGCTVGMEEEGTLSSLAIAHVDPEKERALWEISRKFFHRLNDGSGSGTVMATGKSILRKVISDEYLASTAQSEEHFNAMRAMGFTSYILLPLKCRGQVVGVMRLFSGENGRRLTEDDLSFAEDLAGRASSAIENAQLYRERGLSESRYRSLIEATASLAFTTDADGNFAEPQPAWSAYCGQTWEEARGYGWAMALHPDDRLRLIEAVREAVLDTGGPHQNRGRVWHAASREYRHCTVRAVPMKDSEGNVWEWVGVIVDVHDQVLAEERLRRTEQLAAAGRLAATIAHEINNPLESVTNLIYLAEQSAELDKGTREYLEIASRELQRAAHIVRQTLGFYRENAAPSVADIGEIAEGVIELYQRNFTAKTLRVIAEIKTGIRACVVPGEIRQVIANLVANSIDASDCGGEIRVTVEGDERVVTIRVADRGTGIADEYLPHLFEPFFTTKKDVGTGLGLWVSRDLVEKHHGTLALETKTGPDDHGTVFTAVLPMSGIAPQEISN
jgi:PAS domain S-box-containing protein